MYHFICPIQLLRECTHNQLNQTPRLQNYIPVAWHFHSTEDQMLWSHMWLVYVWSKQGWQNVFRVAIKQLEGLKQFHHYKWAVLAKEVTGKTSVVNSSVRSVSTQMVDSPTNPVRDWSETTGLLCYTHQSPSLPHRLGEAALNRRSLHPSSKPHSKTQNENIFGFRLGDTSIHNHPICHCTARSPPRTTTIR